MTSNFMSFLVSSSVVEMENDMANPSIRIIIICVKTELHRKKDYPSQRYNSSLKFVETDR